MINIEFKEDEQPAPEATFGEIVVKATNNNSELFALSDESDEEEIWKGAGNQPGKIK